MDHHKKNYNKKHSAALLYFWKQELIPDQVPLLAHVSPNGLFVSFARVSMMLASKKIRVRMEKLKVKIDAEIQRLEDMNREREVGDDELPPLFPFTWQDFAGSRDDDTFIFHNFAEEVKQGMLYDFYVASTMRLIELAAIPLADPKFARSIVKVPASSAIRKSMRYPLSPLHVAKRMIVTTLKSQAIYWTSVLIVSSGYDMWESWRPKSVNAQQQQQQPKSNYEVVKNRWNGIRSVYTLVIACKDFVSTTVIAVKESLVDKSFQFRTILRIIRCIGGWISGSLGASVGTLLIRPGLGTSFGVIAFPMIYFSQFDVHIEHFAQKHLKKYFIDYQQ